MPASSNHSPAAPRRLRATMPICAVWLLSVTACASSSPPPSTVSAVVSCPAPPPMPQPTEPQPSTPYLQTWSALVQKWRAQLQATLPTP